MADARGHVDRRRADRRGPAGGVPDQGDPRGQDPHHAGPRPTSRTSGAVLDAARQALVDPTVAALFTGWERAHPAGRPRGDPRHQARPADPARHPRRLPGHRGAEPGRSSTPTTAGRSTLEPLAARLARLDDGAGPRDLADEKLLVTSRALRLRRSLPEAFVGPDSRVPAAGALVGPLAAPTPGPSTGDAARGGRRHPARGRRRPARRLGRPHGRAARRRLARRAHRPARDAAGSSTSRPLLDRLPVALLVRAEG